MTETERNFLTTSVRYTTNKKFPPLLPQLSKIIVHFEGQTFVVCVLLPLPNREVFTYGKTDDKPLSFMKTCLMLQRRKYGFISFCRFMKLRSLLLVPLPLCVENGAFFLFFFIYEY